MRFRTAVLAAALALSVPANAQVAAQTPPPESVEVFAKQYAGPGVLPGMVVAIGRGDEATVFQSAGRISFAGDAPAAGPDSLWRIYSMTKPVTGIAAMILVQEGKLRLDQPISDFIPAFGNMRVLDDPNGLASHPATQPITVRHLLTHTSGLGYTIVTKGPLLAEYQRLGLTPAAFSEYSEDEMRAGRPATLAEFANRVASLPLVAEPGSRWSYSVSLDVLGRVIEVASGMPFDRFVERRLLTPLKMRSTYFTVPRDQAGRLATNYTYFGDIPVSLDPGAHSAWLKRPSFPYGGAAW